MTNLTITFIGGQFTDCDVLDPIEKGNVLVNIFRRTKPDGSHVYTFEILAHNEWAGQWKPINIFGWIDDLEARRIAAGIEDDLLGFSWEANDFLYKNP